MNKLVTAVLYLVAYAFASCNNDTDKTLDTCPVVSNIKIINGDSLLFAEERLMKDTLQIPLSLLTEEMEIIRLDNKDEALVGEQQIVVSDNYLLCWNGGKEVFMLFDRKGKLLRSIGAIGQGPGEYQTIYDAHIDEANNRIYLFPWTSSQMLVYDLQGNVLPPIPLCARCPKAKFGIYPEDSLIAVFALPFPDMPAVAWTQDFNANRKTYIEPGSLMAYDYNTEVYHCGNTDAFDCMLTYCLPTREDTLYHYDFIRNRLRPRFTMQYTITNPIPNHHYQELSHYYIGSMAQSIQISKNMFGNSIPISFIVDRQSGKGAYMHLINDFLGDEELPLTTFDGRHPPYPNFRNGYYILNNDPGNLRDKLEKKLHSEKLSPEKREKVSAFLNSIYENDNNILFLARLKK